MSGFRSPLDAYREDLSRAPGRKRLAAGDEFWIILATGLRRLSQAPARSRPAAARRLARAIATFERNTKTLRSTGVAGVAASTTGRPSSVADALARFAEPEAASGLATHVRGTAADAEEAGAVILAREILTDLLVLISSAAPLERGLVLLQLGRISRTLGDLDSAVDFLRAVGDIGRTEGVQELIVREALGEAVVARTRGNYPASRRLFETALEGATLLGLADAQGMCHQGLMAADVAARDFDSALTHGWQAFSAARTHGSRVAEMLGNLADVCAQTGYDAAAVGGFVAALSMTAAPRVRLPVLAGLAKSAGRLGDRKRVDDVERAVVSEANDAFPFESASAWLAIARARRMLGDTAASETAAKHASDIAHAHGFFEITHHLEQNDPPPPVPLADRVMGVIRSLEAWTDDPSRELQLSSVSTD